MTELVTALTLIFVTAGALLIVANHFDLPAVPFYLVAGLIVGFFVEQESLLGLALWGIAFLVFVFGLRFDYSGLRHVAKDAEYAAITQIALVAPLAYLVARALGFDALDSVYFSAAATLSSTLVGTSLMEPGDGTDLVHSRLASSVHLFDDLVAVALILVLSADSFTPVEVTSQIGYGVLFFMAAFVFHRYCFRAFKQLAGGSSELLLMGSISVLILFVAAAEAVDVSIVVGAFAAGIAIPKDDVMSIDIHDGVESIKEFFAAIFFVSVGALVVAGSFVTDEALATVAVAAALSLLVLLVNPFVLMMAFGREGYDPRTGFYASTSLNQVSEFSLVIVIQAALVGAVSETMFDAVILAAAVTMILASAIHRYDDVIYSALVEDAVSRVEDPKTERRSNVGDVEDHVVVVGYGGLGRRIAEECRELGVDHVVVENDPVKWDVVREDCENYVFGDAMSRGTWRYARVEDAELVVSTVDHLPASRKILSFDLAADVFLLANSSRDAVELLEEGATFVSVPNVLAADRLSEKVSEAIESAAATAEGDGERTLRDRHLEELDRLDTSYRFEGRGR